MNIRKLIMTVTVAVMTLATTTGFAKIAYDDLNLGGIYLGQPMSEIITKFGQPKFKARTPDFPNGYYGSFNCGNFKLYISTTDSDNGVVFELTANNDCQFVTKAGIGIGSSLASVKAAYGEPDLVNEKTDIVYLAQYTYFVKDDNKTKLSFLIRKDNGKVEGIYFVSLSPNRDGSTSQLQ